MQLQHKIFLTKTILLLIYLLPITGCNASNKQNDNLIPTPESILSIATSDELVTPTETALVPTKVEVTKPVSWIRQQCPKISSISTEISKENIVAMDKDFKVAFLDITNGKTVPIFEKSLVVKVSPDGKWLAYYPIVAKNQRKDISLTILSSEKIVYRTYPWQDDWTTFSWLNNYQLLIGRFDTESTAFTEINFMLLDIITDQQTELPYKYPNMVKNYPPLDMITWENFWPLVYDPTLTRVAYARTANDFPTISLWDMQNKQEISTVNVADFSFYPTEPKWSMSGDKFIISALFVINKSKSIYGNDLFSVSRDGTISRLTYFTDDAGNSPTTIREYKWSPDSRSVGIWTKSQNNNLGFGILDIGTGTLTNYCLEGAFDNPNTPTATTMTWSPDSKSILVTFTDNTENTKTLLIDKSKGVASETISEGLVPIGWLFKAP